MNLVVVLQNNNSDKYKAISQLLDIIDDQQPILFSSPHKLVSTVSLPTV